MEIVKVELNLKAVNKEVAVFNCEKKVSGVIHATEDGKTTVVLDGGYMLGKYDCPQCAITEISMLAVKISEGNKKGLGNYRQYKRDFMEEAISIFH